ncbi:MAG: Na+/H+ antiporter NhaA, partial [Chloroflexi bacterium]|nr:Na+/H+ antiporter NhaA [Chloroflexota bacterium]
IGAPPKPVRALRVPIQTFIHTEEIGAIILLLGAAAALVWANSPWSESYFDFWHINIAFDIHIFTISEDLRHLINDGLMAVFFFLVGLEIKRELLHGELSTVRKAGLPVVAAVGGMAFPALVYLLFNRSGDGVVGWGIPVATDIAFALGVLGLLGRRLPSELRVFLLGLAVVDDVGAIAIIAIFYTETIHWANLGLGIASFAVIAVSLRFGFRSLGVYLIMCIGMWYFFLESGIHATLAGVLVATIIPSEPRLHRRDYAAVVDDLLRDYRLALARNDDEQARLLIERIESVSRGTEGPMERLEGIVHPWVSFVILPLFALANAGIVFTSNMLTEAVSSPVTIGVAAGLLAGKALGIFGMTWGAVRLGICHLPSAVSWRHVLGAGVLAGIGFTVSIFVSSIAFTDPLLVDQAKVGIFGASILAGAIGYLVLRFASAPTSAPGAEGVEVAHRGQPALRTSKGEA